MCWARRVISGDRTKYEGANGAGKNVYGRREQEERSWW